MKGELIRAYYDHDGTVWNEWSDPEEFARGLKDDTRNLGCVFGEPLEENGHKYVKNEISGSDSALENIVEFQVELKQMTDDFNYSHEKKKELQAELNKKDKLLKIRVARNKNLAIELTKTETLLYGYVEKARIAEQEYEKAKIELDDLKKERQEALSKGGFVPWTKQKLNNLQAELRKFTKQKQKYLKENEHENF